MAFPLPSQLTCPHCGAVAFPTDGAVSASQSNASYAIVWFQCAGAGCRRQFGYSPITGRITG